MRRRSYRIEWAVIHHKPSRRVWRELGTPGGRIDTFPTRAAAEAKATKLERRARPEIVTRIISPKEAR